MKNVHYPQVPYLTLPIAIWIIFFLLTFLLFSCNVPKSKKEKKEGQIAWYDSIMKENAYIDSLLGEEEIMEEEQGDFSCEIQYDTITNNKYTFHKTILDILNSKSSKKLDDQMVAVFMRSLNPYESEFHEALTNKVIFEIIEKQTAKLSNYNPKSFTAQQSDCYEYFFYHLEHPKCNTLPLGEIIKKVVKEFPSGEVDGPKKKRILDCLTYAFYFQNETTPKFQVQIVINIPGDSLGADISITKNGKPFKSIKSDGASYFVSFDLNSNYLITCSKNGYSTKIVSVDTNIPKGREAEEFARFTMDIGLMKKSIDNKRDTALPVGGVAYIKSLQDFDVVENK